MEINLSTKFFIREEGGKKECELEIAIPETSGEDDVFCIVRLPGLLGNDKRIFGVDAEQAEQLAVKFVTDLLANKELMDSDGNIFRSSEIERYLRSA